MFNNVGSKIKTLAKVLCWVGIILSVVSGIIIMVAGNNIPFNYNYGYNSYRNSGFSGSTFVIGLIVIVVGSLCSWLSSLFTYGFGQLIENTDNIRENTRYKG